MSLNDEELKLLESLKDAGQKFIFLSPTRANTLVSMIGELTACADHDLYWEPGELYDARDYKGRTYRIKAVKATSIGGPVSGEAAVEFPKEMKFDTAVIVGLNTFYEFSEGFVIDAASLAAELVSNVENGRITFGELRARQIEKPGIFRAYREPSTLDFGASAPGALH